MNTPLKHYIYWNKKEYEKQSKKQTLNIVNKLIFIFIFNEKVYK